MRRKNIIIIVVATALLLMVPLVAMQYTEEVKWSVIDFVVAGILLLGAGLTYEFVANRGGSLAYRVGVGVGCAAGLGLIWVNLAVGLIGNEDNPANALYVSVLAVALIGIALARFEPRKMSRAMYAAAIAQAIVPVIAMIIWKPPFAIGVLLTFGANALFVALWVVSASLFRHASDVDPKWSRSIGVEQLPRN
ncbi:MAG: hypothetical protein WAU88_04395 [Candidatus Zixiibacteriota bacterium]